MSFFKKLFGTSSLDGHKLATSNEKSDYAQIALLACFVAATPLHPPTEQVRWNRTLPQPYDETIQLLQKQGWLAAVGDRYQVTSKGMPFVETYQSRQGSEQAEVMPKVRRALQSKETGEALDLRRAYEARQPLGQADWTGPEPQLSHSSLTRRIFFMQHPMFDGLSKETLDWLKLYAAEQHLWGASWRLPLSEIPAAAQQELAKNGLNAVEAAYWKALQLGLYVENQETWQRCKGGDHVRRIEIVGPNDDDTCLVCKPFLGKQFLVTRTPELPPKECTSPIGCRCRYEPVLETSE